MANFPDMPPTPRFFEFSVRVPFWLLSLLLFLLAIFLGAFARQSSDASHEVKRLKNVHANHDVNKYEQKELAPLVFVLPVINDKSNGYGNHAHHCGAYRCHYLTCEQVIKRLIGARDFYQPDIPHAIQGDEDAH